LFYLFIFCIFLFVLKTINDLREISHSYKCGQKDFHPEKKEGNLSLRVLKLLEFFLFFFKVCLFV